MKMDKMKITVSMAAALLSIAASAELALVPKPAQMREIRPGHLVLCTTKEFEQYKKELGE